MRKDPVLSAQLNSMKSTPSLFTSCNFVRHCVLLQCPSPFFPSSVNVHSCNFNHLRLRSSYLEPSASAHHVDILSSLQSNSKDPPLLAVLPETVKCPRRDSSQSFVHQAYITLLNPLQTPTRVREKNDRISPNLLRVECPCKCHNRKLAVIRVNSSSVIAGIVD